MTQRVIRSSARVPWGIGAVVGAIIAVTGLLLVLSPLASARSIIALCIGGALIALAIGAFARRTTGGVVSGVLLLLLGIFTMVFPRFAANGLISFGGLILVLLAVLMLVFAARFGAAAVVPAVVLLAGGIVAFIWPGVILGFLAIVGGLGLLAFGVWLCVRSFRLRKTEVSSTTLIVE